MTSHVTATLMLADLTCLEPTGNALRDGEYQFRGNSIDWTFYGTTKDLRAASSKLLRLACRLEDEASANGVEYCGAHEVMVPKEPRGPFGELVCPYCEIRSGVR